MKTFIDSDRQWLKISLDNSAKLNGVPECRRSLVYIVIRVKKSEIHSFFVANLYFSLYRFVYRVFIFP